ncbi:hypothetical protein [Klebsiella phage vB_KpnM_TU02]|nr:hypothetical protein [Klebsiella phage vB_KpnM_TU02]
MAYSLTVYHFCHNFQLRVQTRCTPIHFQQLTL